MRPTAWQQKALQEARTAMRAVLPSSHRLTSPPRMLFSPVTRAHHAFGLAKCLLKRIRTELAGQEKVYSGRLFDLIGFHLDLAGLYLLPCLCLFLSQTPYYAQNTRIPYNYPRTSASRAVAFL